MMTRSLARRGATAALLALSMLAIPFAAPIGIAQACGCGAFSPSRGGQASVPQETGLVRVSADTAPGATFTEDIYLSLTLNSDVRTGALLFPVPDKHAVVSAGPRDTFATLARITAPPLAPTRAPGGTGNGAGAPAPTVVVQNRQAIGPLDVVTLSSNDAGALTTWLTDNGFNAKPALAAAAGTYVAKGWAFVAVRLRPAAASTASLDGQLDPLHLRFRTREIVYPMRLSHLATVAERVTVCTLAPHSLALRTANPGMSKVWARRLDPTQHPDLAAVTSGGATFLTRYDGTLRPATITDDFHFASDRSDTTVSPTRTVVTEGPPNTSNDDDVTPPAQAASSDDAKITLVVLGSIFVLGLLATALVITQRRGRGQRG